MLVGIPIRHPLVDEVTAHSIRVEIHADVVRLSVPLADLFARPVLAGRRLALVTPESSRVTIGLRSALVAAGGVWAVITPHGYRDGITGVDHASLDQVVAAPRPADDPEAAADSLPRTVTPAADVTAQLSVDATLLHPASQDTLLGGALEEICRAIGGYQPLSWGRTEPLEMVWDRWVLTQDARHAAPESTRIAVEGDHFSAAVTARVTENGIEETMAVTADVPGGEAALDAAVTRLAEALASLTRTGLPTFALVLARQGEIDRCFRPVTYPPPNPVALLIGAPSVRRLELDARDFAEEQDVLVVGRPSRPAYLLPLGDSERSGWDALHDALDSVGSERLMTLVAPPLLQAWEDDLHGDLDLHGDPHPHTRVEGDDDAP